MNSMTEVLLVIAAPALITLFVKIVLFISDSVDRKECEMAKRPADCNPYKFGCAVSAEKAVTSPVREKKPSKAVIYENRRMKENVSPKHVPAEVSEPETETHADPETVIQEEIKPVMPSSPDLDRLREWLSEPHVVAYIRDSLKNKETTIPSSLLPHDRELVKKLQWFKFELGFSSVRFLENGDVKIRLM